MRAALAWARPGDVLVLTVHAYRDTVTALMQELVARKWRRPRRWWAASGEESVPRVRACSCSRDGWWDERASPRLPGESHTGRRAVRQLADGRNAALGVARLANLPGFVTASGASENESSYP